MAKTGIGPEMFSDLTDDEVWVLSGKLVSGAETAWKGTHDHDVASEIFDVIGDVQANFSYHGKSR